MHPRRLLTDAKFHAAYMDELLPRLNDMRVRARLRAQAGAACTRAR